MPGKVVRVLVKAGDQVTARQPVVVVEAMKMENELRASRDGTVAEIHGARRDVGRRRRAARRHPVNVFKRLRGHRVVRYVSLCLTIIVALLAAAIVTSVTIDLGPVVRARAEDAGSKYIERPLHIGALRIHLLTGKVLVEDLTIDGLHPGDRPFFTAKQIAVALDWVPAFSRQPDITISSVEMTDWQMLVEKWDGAHNFPRFSHDDGKPPGPKRFTTTLKYLRAFRGQFAFEDHETPWSMICPNLDINITNLPNYHGTADLHAAARSRSRTSCRCGRT